ncbi:Icarapin-like [Orchesella cincta]|uniref:Icarapin-like n=1 Tax=Orchesella cincta TaxID=48709 RepID=A0A1D2MDZ1_ORCCI|nr:Icarapin-like [Orchesella cincta]
MHNMRQQMDSLFSSLFAPNPGFFNPNRQFFPRPFFPSVPADSSGEDTKEFLDFGKLPPNYKNSTSETKVVDGKVIEVNKTVHKISGDNSNGFFQFSVIKIRPSEDTPAAEEDKQQPEATVIEEKKPDEAPEAEVTTIKAQQESEMNNPSLNEVDQDEKMSNTKYETDPGLLEEEPSKDAPVSLPLTQEVIYDFVPLQLQSMPLIQASKGDDGKNKPHDLSTDLRINNLMANNENGRLRTLVDPDEIEIIEV